MLLKILHRTEYSYDSPVNYALQRLRLTPQTSATQRVVSWSVNVEGAREEVRFRDHFGNETQLVSADGAPHVIGIVATGVVETYDTSGIYGRDGGLAPLWLFESPTTLTAPGPGVRKLLEAVTATSEIDRLHELMHAIKAAVAFNVGATGPETTAEQALEQGSGVCQDHAHVFIAASRAMGHPARYVSGYLLIDDRVDQVASHAWAEAYVNGLGWVSFDAANGMSTDERYARIAVGRDYRDAMPVSGIRIGNADERLAVHITVEQ
ncbi:MAG: transglutaminase family protein [Rhizobiaceae bacterium]|nr:transglutaminase family protein [Rhizobiaceae bacterium]